MSLPQLALVLVIWCQWEGRLMTYVEEHGCCLLEDELDDEVEVEVEAEVESG